MDAERLKTVVLEKRKGLLVALQEKRIEIKELSASKLHLRAAIAVQQMQEVEFKLNVLDEIVEEANG